jgi:hypothetical protein
VAGELTLVVGPAGIALGWLLSQLSDRAKAGRDRKTEHERWSRDRQLSASQELLAILSELTLAIADNEVDEDQLQDILRRLDAAVANVQLFGSEAGATVVM